MRLVAVAEGEGTESGVDGVVTTELDGALVDLPDRLALEEVGEVVAPFLLREARRAGDGRQQHGVGCVILQRLFRKTTP